MDAPIEYRYGLLHLVVAGAIFNALPNAVPINPARPADPPGGAAAGTVGAFNQQMRLWQEDTKLTKQLHNAIVDSLSPALQLEITDPVLNFIILDCNAIMAQMENLFEIFLQSEALEYHPGFRDPGVCEIFLQNMPPAV